MLPILILTIVFCEIFSEFYDRVDGDLSMSFGGLAGRGRKKQDPPIERDLYLSLEEVFHGCTKKMKISRRVCVLNSHLLLFSDIMLLQCSRHTKSKIYWNYLEFQFMSMKTGCSFYDFSVFKSTNICIHILYKILQSQVSYFFIKHVT